MKSMLKRFLQSTPSAQRLRRGYTNKIYALASSHRSAFEEIVGTDHVVSGDDMEAFTVDWTGTYKGGSLVCLPKTTKEISEIMKYCSMNNIGVVPQGGNTGLVGGAVGTSKGELVVCMRRMNSILDIDNAAGVLTCEAGCVLEWLNGEVAKHGFVVPLDLAAKGSCMIGGNVATNAGGLRVMKYGSLQGNVLGLEVVLADGTVLDMLRSLRKDNSGLHSKHLFIGSEGALGIITKVSLLLVTKPTFTCVIFAKLASFSQIQALLSTARSKLGDTLTAFEFMDRNAINAVRRASPTLLSSVQASVLPSPVAEAADKDIEANELKEGVSGEVSVLLECTGTNVELDQQRVDAFAEAVLESGVVVDAAISQNSDQEKDLWKIRENLTISLAQLARSSHPLRGPPLSDAAVVGRLFKYDLSVRLQDTAELLRRLKERALAAGFRLKGVRKGEKEHPSSSSSSQSRNALCNILSACELEFCNYGHIADQNIHLNILAAVRVAGTAQADAGRIALSLPLSGEHTKYMPAVQSFPVGDEVRARIVKGAASEAAAVFIEEEYLSQVTALVRSELNRHIFDLVLEVNGSISAEHGVGSQKVHALHWARSSAELQVMLALKNALDPHCVLNPGKVLPDAN